MCYVEDAEYSMRVEFVSSGSCDVDMTEMNLRYFDRCVALASFVR